MSVFLNIPIFAVGTTPDGQTLNQIIDKTDNDIILFVIVLIVVGIFVGIPIYRMSLNRQKDEDLSMLNEKKLLIDVVKENSSAIMSLKTTLDLNNNSILNLLQDLTDRVSKNDDRIVNIMNYTEKTDSCLKRFENSVDDSLKTIAYLKEQNVLLADKINSISSTCIDISNNINDIIKLSNDLNSRISELEDRILKN
jgi:DNA repair ATPase RecN